MRVAKVTIAVAFIFSALSTPLRADGNDLLRECTSLETPVEKKDVSSSFDSGKCLGLVTGTLNTLQVLVGTDGEKSLCLPEDVKTKDATQAVVKYLKLHQAELEAHEVTLIIRALMEAYPCK